MSGPTNCSDCHEPLKPNPRRQGTRCKPCNARHIATSPSHREAVSKAMSRRWNDAHERRKLSQAISVGCLKPEVRLERSRRGKICCNARAAAAGSEARRKAGASLSKTRLGWLPASYRPAYFQLRQNDGFRAPEARRIIEGEMERELKTCRAQGVDPPPELVALERRRALDHVADAMRQTAVAFAKREKQMSSEFI